MTLQEYQEALHELYEGNVDYPTTAADEWTHRLGLLKRAINRWAGDPYTSWAELWVKNSDAADGDKTITAGDVDYDCPTDFVRSAAFVTVKNPTAGTYQYFSVIQVEEAHLYLNTGALKCYFTGNRKTGFDLHFLTTQLTTGDTIDYPYYKTPYIPTAAAHVIEMGDPEFAVYYAEAILRKQDGEGDLASVSYDEADMRLKGMKIKNKLPGYLQSKSVPSDSTRGVSGFGT